MTISSILGFRGATTTAATPAAGLGLGLGHRTPSFHSAQHRGDIWIHSSEGWKGGKKGDSAALSALTLLAFLFFLHILQSCLQDMTDTNQPTVVMASSAARQEVPAVPAMVAVPMATPMPMPMPATMAPMVPMAPVQRFKRQSGQGGEQEEHGRHLQRRGSGLGDTAAGWEMVSVVAPTRRYRPRQEPPPRGASTPTPVPERAEDEEAAVERVVSITPAPVGGKRAGVAVASAEDSAMVRVSSSLEGLDEDEGDQSASAANKQEEYELQTAGATEASVPAAPAAVPVPIAVPVAMLPLRPPGHVVRFVPLASTFRGVFSALAGAAGPLLRVVQPAAASAASAASSALGQGLGQGLREGLRSAICCDLVVCEAHRLGSIGGSLGERVATTVSNVVQWVCGESEAGELAAAALRGRGGAARDGEDGAADGCRTHIERCERRAGRRTAVSTLASILEAYITRRP